MLSVSDALHQLLNNVSIVDTTTVELSEAVGRVLAESISAIEPSPSFNNSAMDGFAVISSDLEQASENSPVELKVTGDIPAGHLPKTDIYPGETMRIMTGAITPKSADAVVPVENTNFNNRSSDTTLPETINVNSPTQKGDYIRFTGENYQKDKTLIPAGRRLFPKDIGILAQVGKTTLEVFKQPRIGLFSTGDELLSVDETITPGKIRETNSFTLAALISDCGAEVLNLGIFPDDEGEIRNALDQATDESVDLILSSAGVSVGAYDFIRKIVSEQGDLAFWRVNMRPGKPILFGRYRDVPYIGLPGNPVSSFVGFEVFLRPAINYMSGVENWSRLTFSATIDDAVTSDGRESYLRVVLDKKQDDWTAKPINNQSSGNVHSLSLANGLIIIPAGVKILSAGSQVEAWII